MKTKPFNIEEAKAGAKLVTRGGRPARLICDDAKGEYPVIFLISYDYEEIARTATTTGKYYKGSDSEHDFDILIVDEPCRVKENEHYYTISEDMTISKSLELYDDYDNDMYAVGNYFKTREEAEAMADTIKKLLKGENNI